MTLKKFVEKIGLSTVRFFKMFLHVPPLISKGQGSGEHVLL